MEDGHLVTDECGHWTVCTCRLLALTGKDNNGERVELVSCTCSMWEELVVFSVVGSTYRHCRQIDRQKYVQIKANFIWLFFYSLPRHQSALVCQPFL